VHAWGDGGETVQVVMCFVIVGKKMSRLPKHYTPLHLYIPAHHPDFIY
jgi:hypothetical protein